MSFQVDPDALTASSRLASQQRDHIGAIDDYIGASCSNFGAFSGVLNLFQGSYESAVATAHDGLRDSRAVADKVRDAFIDSRDDYLDTDEATYDRFRALAPDRPFMPVPGDDEQRVVDHRRHQLHQPLLVHADAARKDGLDVAQHREHAGLQRLW